MNDWIGVLLSLPATSAPLHMARASGRPTTPAAAMALAVRTMLLETHGARAPPNAATAEPSPDDQERVKSAPLVLPAPERPWEDAARSASAHHLAPCAC
ncbi:hypothetical protein [Piscinibacter koreensis]|uniref:Uncharacterized protein n=1 Tax=Piscinibacter koreensis TaxID=2742824 RepID=A0A7Y6NRE3_9BURK|nr:hypothetical protein [Schlegelella koreensis]NUZ07933.1 hypothetical protein [Schlegelella koreensis]